MNTLSLLIAAGGLTYCGALFVLWPQIVRETWAMLRKQPPA